MDEPGKRWYRKRQVQSRYGNVCARTVDRAVADRRLPPPKYPFGNKIPYWDGDELDAHDRGLALPNRRNAPAATTPSASTEAAA